MLRFRPLPVLTLVCLAALVVLLWLGRWQWHRFQERSAAAAAPQAEIVLEDYQPLPEGLSLVYGVRAGEPGWRVFAPVRYGQSVVFVDSGFAPGVEPPDWRNLPFPPALSYDAPLRGVPVQPRGAASVTAKAEPERRVFFAADLPRMGEAAGLAPIADYYVAAPYLGTDGRAGPNPFLVQATPDAFAPSRNLGYALTWFGLAIGLVALYLIYHVQTGRLRWARNRP